MRITICAVGRLKRAPEAELSADHCPACGSPDLRTLPEVSPGQESIDRARGLLLQRLPNEARMLAFYRRGSLVAPLALAIVAAAVVRDSFGTPALYSAALGLTILVVLRRGARIQWLPSDVQGQHVLWPRGNFGRCHLGPIQVGRTSVL